MQITPAALPQDLVMAQATIANLRGENEHLKNEIEYLARLVRLLKHQKFAKSSEKISPNQPLMFDEAEAVVAEAVAADQISEETIATTAVPAYERARPKRRPLPAELPRVDVVMDVPEADKVCKEDGSILVKIGEETSEQLEYVPAQFRVLRTIRPKYACKQCENHTQIKIAPVPKVALPRSIASPSLLAQIAVAKYSDSLPLYRQEQIFSRLGIDISRQSMAEWMIRVGGVLTPLINLLEEELLSAPIIHADETSVQVLKEPDKPPESKSYMWVACRREKGRQIVLYHYAASRSGDVPVKLFGGFQGYLQLDGYDGYNKICGPGGATRVGCWAHVRRKFMDALKSLPKGVKDARADESLRYIKELYRIESEAKDFSADELLVVRQQKSKLVIEQLRTWLNQALAEVLPRSLTGTALSYLNNEWQYLLHFLNDARIKLDNNTAENAIRPFVLGRKNWLFCDTPAGAEASAAIYSVIITAKANGVDPFLYLKHVLTELPKAETAEQVEELLPWRYRATLLN